MADPMNVEVVAADRKVWEGTATNVIVRTTEGDIGILPGHEPMLAALVPCAAEIVTGEGRRKIVALEGGVLSVAQNKVSLVSQKASLSDEISTEEAQAEVDRLTKVLDDGDATDEELHRLHLAQAQLKAAAKMKGKQG
ncbi:MAG: F0F1 ATP synthase subunit epsilon [Luteococcus sp.]|uniref:F0F1 ATP synthase subunit epsilon n=1 Tax=Luteococcus sp. TaxID=1969402 RepID=UPI002649761F|nr:F0F1 ATP synthase subunit epsilon [Luteococcus sp.]MDN5562790.1 F0F1 ATP synthase subunit epsilon [Luteococcus sp.]